MKIKLLLRDIADSFIGLNKYVFQEFEILYFIIAVIHFIFTLYTDRLIFEYQNIDIFNLFIIKIIFLIILIFIWQFIGYLIKNYSISGNIKNIVKFSGIYFIVMILLKLSLWPIVVGNNAGDYYACFYDAIYMSNNLIFEGLFIKYFRIYALMLIPNIAGISIVQIIIISLIIGYVMQIIKKYFALNKSIYFFYIPFLTPISIQYNLYIGKDTMYGYSLLFLIAVLLFVKLDETSDKLNKNLVLVAFLSAVVAAIRPGGIFFFVATPLIIYLLNYKIVNTRKIILFIFFNLIFMLIFIPNIVATVILNRDGEAYKNVYILNNTFKFLLKEAIKDDNEYILHEFQSDTNLKPEELLSKKTDLSDGFFRNLPDIDRDKFEIISKKLIYEYFDDYAKYKFMNFYFRHSIMELNKDPHDISKYDSYIRRYYKAVKDKVIQINPDIYSKVANFFTVYNDNIIYHYALVNFILAANIMIFLISIFFKLEKVFVIICFLIGYLILQILMVPSASFRFFFPSYLISYLIIFYLIFYFLSGEKGQNLNFR